MKFVLLSFFLLLVLGCGKGGVAPGDSSGGGGEGDGPDGLGSLYTGETQITSTNASSFLLKGNCTDSDQNIELRGSILVNADCEDNEWSQTVDLSYLSSGRFKVSISHDGVKGDLIFEKNTLIVDAEAAYEFEEVANAGKDSREAHDAQSVANVDIVVDAERDNVVQFNGTDSQIELSDGTFLNEAFSKRSISMYFHPQDVVTRQMLYEEGGATNGLAIRIESSKLIVATRAGGSGTQEELEVDIASRLQKWTHLAVVFNEGTLQVHVEGAKFEKALAYTEIPSHGNDGGIGANYGSSNAFGTSGAEVFNGRLDEVLIFSGALSANEVVLLTGGAPTEEEVNPLEIGLQAKYEFENESDLGVDTQGAHDAKSVVDVASEDDGEMGKVARFNGTSSVFQLNDGTYLNKAFSAKSVAFWMKPDSLSPQQVLYDEGGSTNGMVVWLEDSYLFASVRSGGSSTQTDVILDIIDLQDEWVHVAVVFDEGKLQLYVNGNKVVERTAGFTEVVDHGDSGGLGRRHGSDASGQSGSAIFAGLMNRVHIYGRALTSTEILFHSEVE